jgi:serine/threonine-protein kinase 24/25/MST4
LTARFLTNFFARFGRIAPEIIKGFGYNHKADIWSAGITAIELALGAPPYVELDPMKVLHLIPKAKPPVLEGNFSKLFKDFVAKCLVKDHRQRPDTQQLLKHKFIKKAKRVDVLLPLVAKYREAKAAKKDSNAASSAASTTAAAAAANDVDEDFWDFGE